MNQDRKCTCFFQLENASVWALDDIFNITEKIENKRCCTLGKCFPLYVRLSQIIWICMWGHFSVDEICYTKCLGVTRKAYHLSLQVKKQLSLLTVAEIAWGWVGAVNLRQLCALASWSSLPCWQTGKCKTWTLLDVLTCPACILPRDSGIGREQLHRPQGKLTAGLNKIRHLPFVCSSALLWKQHSACQPVRKSDRLHADRHLTKYVEKKSNTATWLIV